MCHLASCWQGEISVSINEPSWCRKVCFHLLGFSRPNYHGCHSRSLGCRAPCTVHWCKLPQPRSPGHLPTPPSTPGYRSEAARPHRRWFPGWSHPVLVGRRWQDPKNVLTQHLKRVPLPWSTGVWLQQSPPLHNVKTTHFLKAQWTCWRPDHHCWSIFRAYGIFWSRTAEAQTEPSWWNNEQTVSPHTRPLPISFLKTCSQLKCWKYWLLIRVCWGRLC